VKPGLNISLNDVGPREGHRPELGGCRRQQFPSAIVGATGEQNAANACVPPGVKDRLNREGPADVEVVVDVGVEDRQLRLGVRNTNRSEPYYEKRWELQSLHGPLLVTVRG
jgi:hypothetical protein